MRSKTEIRVPYWWSLWIRELSGQLPKAASAAVHDETARWRRRVQMIEEAVLASR